ncbi:hypothetical protein [Microbacterium sediminis]|uniref:Uncharacterized protein n=1 Tax=Microbacterium sediminis TaxID=904291 RepID=A0A1B9NIS3_9MICO|nr:hypothetical protein [Microbacterium sediminis]OCG76483.1 hypothetical protein A7J15_11925 [Microbacterium sediminis]
MGEATGRIERPRITALLDRIPQGSIIFLRTQHRGGIATAGRHWADLRGLSVVWWSSTRDDVPGPGSPTRTWSSSASPTSRARTPTR